MAGKTNLGTGRPVRGHGGGAHRLRPPPPPSYSETVSAQARQDRNAEGCFCRGIRVSLSFLKWYLFLGLKTAYPLHGDDVKVEGSWCVKPVAYFPQRTWQRMLNFPAYL